MILYPAIDLKNGNCVRLFQGNFDKMTNYGNDPIEMAKKWENMGAEYLHVIDLDGARSGVGLNREVIKNIAKILRIPVQTGGGIRKLDDIEEMLSAGIQRVILGTSAVKNREMVMIAIREYGDRIVIGIDAKDGFVAIEGWEDGSDLNAVSFAREMVALHAKTIVYTDIATDGTLEGPNLAAMKEMILLSGADIIASGGVGSIADLIALQKIGAYGAITGKAIYTGTIQLHEAIEALKNETP